jgi:metal transporter CNNM
MLGKDEGIIYRRAELKELVAIHGNHHEGPLSKNEVTIIRGAMDLQEKTAATIMTDLENVFAIDSNTMLNYESMNSIVEAGYSRVPVYEDSIEHIVGVVLIKSLIMLDPNDSTPVRDLKINHLPRVDGSTPLYEMLDKFQEGNSKYWCIQLLTNNTVD